jgi:hypothetical protein
LDPLASTSDSLEPWRDYDRRGRQENGRTSDQVRMDVPVASHCESIKQHLNGFDMDASLNNVRKTSYINLHNLIRQPGGRMFVQGACGCARIRFPHTWQSKSRNQSRMYPISPGG